MIKKTPNILGISLQSMKEKLEDLCDLGFSYSEVINMTTNHPTLFNYTFTYIKDKINDIISLGLTMEEVKHIIKVFPSILGLSIENIKEKVEFYDSIGLHDLMIINPKKLMQSVNLSYARYMFFKEELNQEITMNNYPRLFMSQERFESSFGYTKEELLSKYPFDLEKVKELKK